MKGQFKQIPLNVLLISDYDEKYKQYIIDNKRLYNDLIAPPDNYDSGLDVMCKENITICANQLATIKLGFRAAMIKVKVGISVYNNMDTRNTAFYIMPRSSFTATPLIMQNSPGLIDCGYRGELMVKVRNIGNTDYKIYAGDRLFQIVAPDTRYIYVKLVDKLDDTNRGDGGFGSTGK